MPRFGLELALTEPGTIHIKESKEGMYRRFRKTRWYPPLECHVTLRESLLLSGLPFFRVRVGREGGERIAVLS